MKKKTTFLQEGSISLSLIGLGILIISAVVLPLASTLVKKTTAPPKATAPICTTYTTAGDCPDSNCCEEVFAGMPMRQCCVYPTSTPAPASCPGTCLISGDSECASVYSGTYNCGSGQVCCRPEPTSTPVPPPPASTTAPTSPPANNQSCAAAGGGCEALNVCSPERILSGKTGCSGSRPVCCGPVPIGGVCTTTIECNNYTDDWVCGGKVCYNTCKIDVCDIGECVDVYSKDDATHVHDCSTGLHLDKTKFNLCCPENEANCDAYCIRTGKITATPTPTPTPPTTCIYPGSRNVCVAKSSCPSARNLGELECADYSGMVGVYTCCAPATTPSPTPASRTVTPSLTPTLTLTPTASPTPAAGGGNGGGGGGTGGTGGSPTGEVTFNTTSAVCTADNTAVDLRWTSSYPANYKYKVGFCDHTEVNGAEGCKPATYLLSGFVTSPYRLAENTSVPFENTSSSSSTRDLSHWYGWWVKVYDQSNNYINQFNAPWFDCNNSQPTATTALPACRCQGTTRIGTAGDANCDGRVDLVDFEIWRGESLGLRSTKSANFNCDAGNLVNQEDYLIWKANFQ